VIPAAAMKRVVVVSFMLKMNKRVPPHSRSTHQPIQPQPQQPFVSPSTSLTLLLLFLFFASLVLLLMLVFVAFPLELLLLYHLADLLLWLLMAKSEGDGGEEQAVPFGKCVPSFS